MHRQQRQIEDVETYHASGDQSLYGASWGDPATKPALIPIRNRLAEILAGIEAPQIMEIGSGGGRWTEQIQRLLGRRSCLTILEGTQAAIDLTTAHLARCRLRPPIRTAVCPDGRRASIPDIAFDWTVFDAVFSFDVFVHFDDALLTNYFDLIADQLRNGGRALISVACEHTGPNWIRGDDWFNYIATWDGHDYTIREPFREQLDKHFELQQPILIDSGHGQLVLDLVRK